MHGSHETGTSTSISAEDPAALDHFEGADEYQTNQDSDASDHFVDAVEYQTDEDSAASDLFEDAVEYQTVDYQTKDGVNDANDSGFVEGLHEEDSETEEDSDGGVKSR